MKKVIWGPHAGSSRISLQKDVYGRVIIKATTDFGEANCVFSVKNAIEIRDALNELCT